MVGKEGVQPGAVRPLLSKHKSSYWPEYCVSRNSRQSLQCLTYQPSVQPPEAKPPTSDCITCALDHCTRYLLPWPDHPPRARLIRVGELVPVNTALGAAKGWAHGIPLKPREQNRLLSDGSVIPSHVGALMPGAAHAENGAYVVCSASRFPAFWRPCLMNKRSNVMQAHSSPRVGIIGSQPLGM